MKIVKAKKIVRCTSVKGWTAVSQTTTKLLPWSSSSELSDAFLIEFTSMVKLIRYFESFNCESNNSFNMLLRFITLTTQWLMQAFTKRIHNKWTFVKCYQAVDNKHHKLIKFGLERFRMGVTGKIRAFRFLRDNV